MFSDFYVYTLLDPTRMNQPFYVGKGRGDRWKDHLREKPARGLNRRKFSRIKRLISAGTPPAIRLLATDLQEADAYRIEATIIRWWGRKGFEANGFLLNIHAVGSGPPSSAGRAQTESARIKIGAAHKGKTISAAQRQLISAKMKGRPKKSGHGESVSRGLSGYVRTAEHRANLGASHRGKVISPEARRKISEALKGKPKPAGFGAKVSATMKSRTGESI
jgi:hypothetical protein